MLQQAQFSTSNILNTDAYIEQNWEGKRKKKKKNGIEVFLGFLHE